MHVTYPSMNLVVSRECHLRALSLKGTDLVSYHIADTVNINKSPERRSKIVSTANPRTAIRSTSLRGLLGLLSSAPFQQYHHTSNTNNCRGLAVILESTARIASWPRTCWSTRPGLAPSKVRAAPVSLWFLLFHIPFLILFMLMTARCKQVGLGRRIPPPVPVLVLRLWLLQCSILLLRFNRCRTHMVSPESEGSLIPFLPSKFFCLASFWRTQVLRCSPFPSIGRTWLMV